MGMAILCFRVVSVMTMIVAAAASRYMVGDGEGWKMPEDGTKNLYQTWASKIRFQVGDSIVFQYRNDSVVRVDKRGYYHCNETSHGSVFRDGNTVFTLDRAGFYYFVTGDVEHCKKGQRLTIQVAGPPSPFPATPSPAPSKAATLCCLQSLLLVLMAMAWGLSPVLVLPSTLF